jgi:hypothetical protein
MHYKPVMWVLEVAMIIIANMQEEYVKRDAIQPPLQYGTFEQ